MTIINKAEIRKGDKIKVTFTHGDIEGSKTGVANTYNSTYGDWKTAGHMYLNVDGNGAVIELLERPKSAEEILEERRKLMVQVLTGSFWGYSALANPMQKAVDKIIELEDKLAEKEEI